MLSPRKTTYYRRVITILLLLSVLFYLPSLLLFWHSSTSSMTEIITASNEEHLRQIYTEFEKSSRDLGQTVYSIYLDNTMQRLLYGTESGYASVSKINDLIAYFPAARDSIYSIGFYNSTLKEYNSTVLSSKDDSLSFVSGLSAPPKMRPIFRKIQAPYGNAGEIYLCSYLMYEYKMTQGNPSSFVIINQNIEGLIAGISQSSYMAKAGADVVLVGEEIGVCGTLTNISPEEEDSLFQQVQTQKAEASSGTFSVKQSGTSLLVSYITLSSSDVCAVIIQPRSTLFADLHHYNIRFLVMIAITLGIYLIIVIIFTRVLYRPIEELRAHIHKLEGSGFQSQSRDEFEQFKTVYSHFSSLKERYYFRYKLEQLLTLGDGNGAREFAEAFPDHTFTKHDRFLVLSVSIAEKEGFDDPDTEASRGMNLFIAQNIADETLRENYELESIQTDASHFSVILCYEGDFSAVITSVRQVKKNIGKYFDFEISVFLSAPCEGLANLNQAYQDVCLLATYKPLFGNGCILSYDMIEDNLKNTAISYSPENLNALRSAVQTHQEAEIRFALQELSAETKKLSIQNVWYCISLLINYIRTLLEEQHPKTSQAAGILDNLQPILNHFMTVDLFFQELEEALLSFLEAEAHTTAEGMNKNSAFLREVEAFIEGHYQDPALSPWQIAQHTGVSAGYLPRKFQQLSGISLTNYILKVRMDHAAALLLEGKLSNADISYAVGIENPSYFYKLFKKHFGCTPGEYKARHAGQRSYSE